MPKGSAPSPSVELTDDIPRSGLKSHQAWFIVVVLTLANVSGFVDRQILTVLVGPLKRDLHISDLQVSLLMGLGFVAFYSILGLPIGRWVDRGRRGMIVAIGAVGWSLMTAATGLAHGFAQLFAARIGIGVGEATLGPAAVSLIGDAFPRRRLGMAMGVYAAGIFFGSGIAYALSAWVVGALDVPGVISVPVFGDIFPWQRVFFIVGLPGLLVALLAISMREPARSNSPSTIASDSRSAGFRDLLAHVRQNKRTVAALTLGFAFSASVNYGVGAWMATFFVRTHGWTIQQAGLLQGSMTMLFGVAGSLLGGRLTDYLSKRGHVDAPILVGMVGAAGMLACAGLYPIVPSERIAAALILPVNIFAAMPWGAANAAVAEVMPPRLRGQGSALYQLVVNLVSGALGPTAVALLTDRVFHDEAALRYSLSICAVVGMSITLALLGWGRPAFRSTVGARVDES